MGVSVWSCPHMGTTVPRMEPAHTVRAVAAAVSQALADAGISQREAAQSTGIPITTLSRRLTGKSPLDVDELAALAALAGVTLASLIPEAA